MKRLPLTLIVAAAVLAIPLLAQALPLDSVYRFAWGENIGWLNWDSVDVPDEPGGDIVGYVWGENIGWVSLNCSNTSSCGTVDYGLVRESSNEVTGYAWGENVGWISFNCSNTSSCGTVDYGVTVGGNGEFTGFAWGENIGWISLNCSNTGTCGAVDYKVAVDLPTVSGGGSITLTGGGSVIPGGSPTPSPAATPTALPPGATPYPAAIIIDEGTTATDNRIVTLDLYSPFGNAPGVTVTLLNDASATPADRTIIANARHGQTSVPEISGVRTAYQPKIPGWDLCLGRTECPLGRYTVYAQFIKPATGAAPSQSVLAAVGDEVSPPYADAIDLAASVPTPAPSPGPSASPGASPAVSPGVTPAASVPPGPSPSAMPSASPGPAEPTAPPTVGPGPEPAPGPVMQAVQAVGDFLDRVAEGAFGGVFSGPGQCEGALGLSACIFTALGMVTVAIAFIAAIAQKELWAAGQGLLQAFGLKKKERVWGVVYDAATKRPIPSAKLELIDPNGRVMETRYADRDGRYGFLTTPASLNTPSLEASIRASKPGYRFPSSLMVSGTDYVVYDKVYRGEQFSVAGESLVNFSIPLDPVEGRVRLSGLGTGLMGTFFDKLLALGFWVGLVVVPLNYWLFPTTFNLVLLILFIAANIIRFTLLYRPYGMTRDAITGRPMPFALVTLLDETGARAGFAVSDEHGRYVLSGERNRVYDIVAYTPAQVVPQRTVRKHVTAISRMRRTAWMTATLKL